MMVPNTKPRLSLAELQAKLAAVGFDYANNPFFVVGVRGYYRDTMGAPGINDRGIYDDAGFLVSPAIFAAYNFNTDPSRVRAGSGFGAAKGMAVLKPGVYHAHRFGLHRGKYMALIQTGGPVTVMRDKVGGGSYEETGMFGINIHKGGFNTTSSLGCQTVHPNQWASFIATAQDQAKRYGIKTVPYVLLDG